MSRYAFAHARAVLPDRTLDDALVVVEDGRITEVAPVTPGAVPAGAVDLGGALLLPGIIDTHSDALEKEQRPRPTVEFEPGFAVLSFEGRVRAAGVTTMHHAVSYQTNAEKDRTIERSLALAAAVRERAASGVGLIDHRLLHRLDARDADALDALKGALTGQPHTDVPPLVSYEDHTPASTGTWRRTERSSSGRSTCPPRTPTGSSATASTSVPMASRSAPAPSPTSARRYARGGSGCSPTTWRARKSSPGYGPRAPPSPSSPPPARRPAPRRTPGCRSSPVPPTCCAAARTAATSAPRR
ncbi:hypothetical protein ACIQPP_39380 [Streptomyces violaceusniger]|uniref:hypothetical protein n=1 Tax=Streptomyces violaceusniger TaxID=68280 RepID=UPI0009975E7A|nr:hypothetical protein [Streptomyces hygroscopicus]AQW56266.1 phosphonate metabolism protein PhnM [Streptomyces hygroscopicus]